MCEVNFLDFSCPLESDSERYTDDDTQEKLEFSSNSSDTEFEDDVQLDWNEENYNDVIDKKHWENYCAAKYYTVIIPIFDRSIECGKCTVRNMVINYKHDLNRKPQLKRYYCEQPNNNITNKLFSRIFYSPTKTFVYWPGEYLTPPDHKQNSPLYCIDDWKRQMSAPIKEPKFYTLFAVKERYHKLFNPGLQLKFYCNPQDQIDCNNLDSSVLFLAKTRTHATRYKYSFLNHDRESKVDGHNEVNCDHEFHEAPSDISDGYISDGNSEDTIIYDEWSYNNT